MCDGVAKICGRGAPTELHARRVDDVACFQLATSSDGCVADRDASDGVAFALDFFPAFAADRPRDASATLQVIVRGVDDGVRVHVRQVPLLDHDFF